MSRLGLLPGRKWAGNGPTGLLKTSFTTNRFHLVWVASKTGLPGLIPGQIFKKWAGINARVKPVFFLFFLEVGRSRLNRCSYIGKTIQFLILNKMSITITNGMVNF